MRIFVLLRLALAPKKAYERIAKPVLRAVEDDGCSAKIV